MIFKASVALPNMTPYLDATWNCVTYTEKFKMAFMINHVR